MFLIAEYFRNFVNQFLLIKSIQFFICSHVSTLSTKHPLKVEPLEPSSLGTSACLGCLKGLLTLPHMVSLPVMESEIYRPPSPSSWDLEESVCYLWSLRLKTNTSSAIVSQNIGRYFSEKRDQGAAICLGTRVLHVFLADFLWEKSKEMSQFYPKPDQYVSKTNHAWLGKINESTFYLFKMYMKSV